MGLQFVVSFGDDFLHILAVYHVKGVLNVRGLLSMLYTLSVILLPWISLGISSCKRGKEGNERTGYILTFY